MTQEHPITPPDELVKEWINKHYGCKVHREIGGVERAIATRAALRGADQELEACCELLDINGCPGKWIDMLRAARRPKPPSLKEQALNTLQRLAKDGYPCNYQDIADWDIIRRALEQLPDPS
jgi:hypothetical protein